MKIRVAIAGYGNLGRGVESSVMKADDMELVAFFTRRDPEKVKTKSGVPVYSMKQAESMKDLIDVLVLCGGSANDLPEQTPELAQWFNVIDSFDTHANIPTHFENVDKVSKKAGKISIISAGWDPGLFSLTRCYSQAVLPIGQDYTFWGKGISQGHSDAIRRIEGVLDARQYTIPVEDAMNRVRNGENPELSTREKHKRECFVVAKEGADLKKIEQAIVTMPNYFSDYDTTVHFISKEELLRDHKEIPHGGIVFRSGTTGSQNEYKDIIEYRLKLDSNPEFTGSVLTAYTRAAFRMASQGLTGCKTVLDIPPAYLHPEDGEYLRKHLI